MPDTALGCVEDAAPFKTLFSTGLLCPVRIIPHADGQMIFPIKQKVCDICSKGEISAGMMEHLLVVQHNISFVVNSTKMEEKPVSGRKVAEVLREKPVIVEIFTGLQIPSDSGEGAFRGKGNKDLPVKGGGQHPVTGNSIVPETVQAEIGITDKLGTGIFLPRLFSVHGFRKYCGKRRKDIIGVRLDDTADCIGNIHKIILSLHSTLKAGRHLLIKMVYLQYMTNR